MKSVFISIIGLFLLFPVQAQPLVFTPQWTPQSQFAGYYVAQEKGFYREYGLEVIIMHPSASNPAMNRMLQGNSHIITLQLIQAIQYIGQGIPLINILQTSQNNSLMLVSHNHIHSLSDLAGKRVGKWKAGFDELAQVLDKEHHLNIQWIPFVQNVNLFLSKAIDATLAMSYNEYFQILSSGIRLQPEGIFRFSELGYNVPEDGVYVTTEFYRTHQEQLRKFAEASRKGWEWARKHPEETLEIVMQQVKKYQVGTNREHQKWMLTEVLNLLEDKTTGKATYTLSLEALQLANELLIRNGIIREEVTMQQLTEP